MLMLTCSKSRARVLIVYELNHASKATDFHGSVCNLELILDGRSMSEFKNALDLSHFDGLSCWG